MGNKPAAKVYKNKTTLSSSTNVHGEEIIQNATRMWQLTFDAIPDMVSIQDKDFRLININKAYKENFNISEDDIKEKKCFEIFHRSNCPAGNCPHKKMLESKQIVREEIYEARLGAYFEVITSPLLADNGELIGSVHVAKDITAKKEIQEAHRKNEDLLRKIAENFPNSYLSIIEKDYTVSFSSGQEFKKQNLDPEMFTGLSVEEIFVDDNELILDEYRKTFNGEERSFEIFINNQYQLYRTVPLISKDGSINRILAFAENITERKLAEKKLYESEERFRTLTEALPHIVWSADKNGKIDFYNKKAYEFRGLKAGDIEKMNWENIIHLDDYKETFEKWNDAVANGKILRFEQRLKRADGEYRWHLIRGVPMTDSSGDIMRWIGTATDIHEQKSLEEILEKRVSEQTNEISKANKYNRGLLEANLDSLVTIGPNGKITDANRAAEMIRGVKRNKIIGTDFSLYFTDPDRARDAYLKTFSEGIIKDFPLTIKHVSGKTTEVLYNASVYRNESGQVMGVFAAARDVTELRKAEMNLRIQADRYNTMLSTTPDGFWLVDKSGKMLDVNDIYLKMSGYSREEFLKFSIPDIEMLESPEETSKHINQIFPTGFDRFETKHRRKDGSLFDVEISVSYLESSDQFICFIRDITEKKEAELNLERERKRFNDVLDMLPAFVVLLTPDYYIRHSNRFFVNRFGVDSGKHCYEFLNHLAEPCLNCNTPRVIKNKHSFEWEWIGPDGRNYYIYDYPFTDVDGTDLVLEMGIDITEMKKAEKEIIKLNVELEKRVQQRTAELRFANQELEAFSYSVSHDLRTPLSAIDGFSKILHKDLSKQLTDEYKDYLNRIIYASDKMSKLISGLLNLSRISRVELKLKKVRLDLIANEILNRLVKSEPSRKVIVEVQPDIFIQADSEFVTILMDNLINNAWKFTRYTRKAKIEVGTIEKNGDIICFVKDNGAGFNMKESEKVFIPFERLHDQKKFEGSGIGLAIVKRIISKHGGRIWAESEIGRGTAFFFLIPG